MYEKIIDALSHWMEATSPARKVADIAAAFLLAIMAGSLFLAYNAESDIRRLAVKALDKTPELNRDLANKLSDPLLADIQKAGGLAVACFRVDLASNTTSLVFYKGPEQLKSKFPRLKSGFDKVPFVFSGMPQAQLDLAAAMMTGGAETTYYAEAEATLIAVPIPDKTNAFLAGFCMAALPGKHAEESPEVTNIRMLLSDFSGSVL